MDKIHYDEMTENLDVLEREYVLQGASIYLFGHCNATEELADLLMDRAHSVRGILDNNILKQGTFYRDIPIIAVQEILSADMENAVVCIAARAYAAMVKQLKQIGYTGRIEKLVDYNSFAEYSLSEETIARKRQRVERGLTLLGRMKEKYSGHYRIYCPFSALGDVYYAMSYLPYFLEEKKITEYVVFTIGKACADVAAMFGVEHIEVLSPKSMDEQIQAVLYSGDKNAFIPHHDRPYAVNVYRILYMKKLPLELLYKYGVFALDEKSVPYRPAKLEKYRSIEEIPQGKAAILSPYAKSVSNIDRRHWAQIIRYYKDLGYAVYTNVAGEEEALPDTERLEVKLSEFQSVVERAGHFIGLRSGLCDVMKWADCKKTALYPDAYYSDTTWKMEEIYHLDGWNNLVLKDDTDWMQEFIKYEEVR